MQRLWIAELFRCPKCGYQARRVHRFLRLNTSFLFSRYSHCPRCGSGDVHRSSKRDHIDSFSKNVLTVLQGVFDAPINKCPACRLQFYDWRRPRPALKASTVASG